MTTEENTLLTALKAGADEHGVSRITLGQYNPATIAGLMAKGRIWKRTINEGEMRCIVHLCDDDE